MAICSTPWRRYPKLTMYLVAVVFFQAIYSILLTTDHKHPTRTLLQYSHTLFGSASNETNSTSSTVPKNTSKVPVVKTPVNIKYNTSNRDYIQLLDNICPHRNRKLKSFIQSDCPCPPTHLKHRQDIKTFVKDVSLEQMETLYPLVKAGGSFTPSCNPVQRVAIIIPMRDRMSHLRTYLHYMHSFLQRQSISYTIFVAEQVPGGPFNKARTMNTGFAVALNKFGPFDCYIFNDVDMFPEDDRNLYACARGVRHFGSHVSKFGYKLPYEGLFGGAIGLSGEQFKKANGFSNTYVGWGGEDDDMYRRVRTRHLPVVRFPTISYYLMLKHKRDKGNPSNPNGGKAWRWLKPKQYDSEGLNTLTYKLEKVELLSMYTRILISYDLRKPPPPTAKKPAGKNQTSSTTTQTVHKHNSTTPVPTHVVRKAKNTTETTTEKKIQ